MNITSAPSRTQREAIVPEDVGSRYIASVNTVFVWADAERLSCASVARRRFILRGERKIALHLAEPNVERQAGGEDTAISSAQRHVSCG